MDSKKLFGTDGIRSSAGEFPLNQPAVVAIGQAIGEKLGGPVLVGQDTRISSPWILELLRQGIARTKASIENAGVIPTPAIALLTRASDFAGGVMISASHNPFGDNGIKVFSSDGTKLSDATEAEIERRIFDLLPSGADSAKNAVPQAAISGANPSPWPGRYQDLLVSHFQNGPQNGQWMKGLRIVTDCANGAMSVVAPALLRRLGADVEVVSASPDGKNINEKCGAVHLETLARAMKEMSADFGVAFDGDGDRSLFVSKRGKHVDGDAVLLLMARRMKPKAVVGTSMTNYALEKILRAEGVALTRVGVGDRYIFEEMLRDPAAVMIGGEPSGHVIFPDFRLSGDGLLTTLKVAEAMVQSRRSLDELTEDWVPSPQMLKGVRVARRVALEELSGLQRTMAAANEVLKDCGRLVVRYSGTEPLLRVMIESDSAERNEEWMKKLLSAIDEDFKNRC